MPANGEYYDLSTIDCTIRERWIIVRGHGGTKFYWGNIKTPKGKLMAETWWVKPIEQARVYSSAKNAKTALTLLRRNHDMLPEWKVRMELYEPKGSQ